ncbi:VanZ family protein [Blastococcus sp. CT_GayMR19]|nr:VanZ family protein [Blastococcus sp. CT_GayMR19]
MPAAVLPRVRSGRVVFASVVVVSLVVLFAPAGDVPGAPPGVDKIVHGVLFLALAATGRWAGLRPAVLLPALVVYAAGSEVLQGLPAIGRTTSAADWLADVVGLVTGLALWERFAARKRR